VTAAPQKLITAEEFFRMPDPSDGSRQELVRGVILTAPLPGARQGACCARVGRRVGDFADERRLGAVCLGSGFITERSPDTVRSADVSFRSRERLPEMPDGYSDIVPDLAVKVVSPNDLYTRVQTKLRHYLTHGVRMVWLVDPEDRSVSVYHVSKPMSILTENDTLTGEDVLPGFTCPVASLFP
jgi:Uma2 family endonuclease